MNPYFYIFGTLLFTVNGQTVLKWRLGSFGIFPAGAKEKALSDSYVFSGFTAVFPALVFLTGIFFRRNLYNRQRDRIIIDTFKFFCHC